MLIEYCHLKRLSKVIVVLVSVEPISLDGISISGCWKGENEAEKRHLPSLFGFHRDISIQMDAFSGI